MYVKSIYMMVYITHNMRESRWSSNTNYKPEQMSVLKLNKLVNADTLTLFEILSEKHLGNAVTKLYLDRDVKRDSQFSKSEEEHDLSVCVKALLHAFGNEHDWAISSRHGYSNAKKCYCISYHFVCQDIHLSYFTIPDLLTAKGLNNLFDMTVYKRSEQLWAIPFCMKSQNDTRILKPLNYTDTISAHIVQLESQSPTPHTPSPTKCTKVIQTKCIHQNKVTSDESIMIDIIRRCAKDYKSVLHKSDANWYYFKTKGVRKCVVTANETHVSNNFVLTLKNGAVMYKCFSSECIHKPPRFITNKCEYIKKYYPMYML